MNIRNEEPTLYDWDLLMSHLDSFLPLEEKRLLDSSVHLFATNNLVNLHNRKMLKSLNSLIAKCVA